MTETRIELTERQFREFVRTVWDEAFSDGERYGISAAHYSTTQAINCESSWENSLSLDALNRLVELDASGERT